MQCKLHIVHSAHMLPFLHILLWKNVYEAQCSRDPNRTIALVSRGIRETISPVAWCHVTWQQDARCQAGYCSLLVYTLRTTLQPLCTLHGGNFSTDHSRSVHSMCTLVHHANNKIVWDNKIKHESFVSGRIYILDLRKQHQCVWQRPEKGTFKYSKDFPNF